jgi:hypothetical protein
MARETKRGVSLPQQVKETIDFAYEYLAPHPDGIAMSANELFGRRSDVVGILVKRGIISKKAYSLSPKGGVGYKYKWEANMAPTKTLYASVTQEVRDTQKVYSEKSRDKKARRQREFNPEDPAFEKQEAANTKAELGKYSDEALWGELKRRGYTIEDNRLCITRKSYLS